MPQSRGCGLLALCALLSLTSALGVCEARESKAGQETTQPLKNLYFTPPAGIDAGHSDAPPHSAPKAKVGTKSAMTTELEEVSSGREKMKPLSYAPPTETYVPREAAQPHSTTRAAAGQTTELDEATTPVKQVLLDPEDPMPPELAEISPSGTEGVKVASGTEVVKETDTTSAPENGLPANPQTQTSTDPTPSVETSNAHTKQPPTEMVEGSEKLGAYGGTYMAPTLHSGTRGESLPGNHINVKARCEIDCRNQGRLDPEHCVCICRNGYTGTFCEMEADPCDGSCCTNKRTSPIEIWTDRAYIDVTLQPLFIHVPPQQKVLIIMDKMLPMLTFPDSVVNRFHWKGKLFTITKVFIKMPGEHAIDGKTGTVEMQFVGRQLTAGRPYDVTLAVMYTQDHTGYAPPNRAMNTIIDGLTKATDAKRAKLHQSVTPMNTSHTLEPLEDKEEVDVGLINLGDLFPDSLQSQKIDNGYYFYEGTETWGRCRPNMDWLILTNQVYLSPSQFKAILQLDYRNVRRGVRPLGLKRIVSYNNLNNNWKYSNGYLGLASPRQNEFTGAVCTTGFHQSPIAINDNALHTHSKGKVNVESIVGPPVHYANVKSLVAAYKPLPSSTTTRLVQQAEVLGCIVPQGFGGLRRIGGDLTELVKIEVHAPSLHHINDREFSVEVHYIHQTKTGAYVILAFMFDATAVSSDFLEELLTNGEVDLNTGLPDDPDYFEYDGSTVSPPNRCQEGTRWYVMKSIQQASNFQVESILGMVAGGGATRPPQPLNGRMIISSSFNNPHAGEGGGKTIHSHSKSFSTSYIRAFSDPSKNTKEVAPFQAVDTEPEAPSMMRTGRE